MTDDELVAAVPGLQAIDEISRLKATYVRLVDEHDWAALTELFTPDLEVDIEESTSKPQGREAFVASVSRHLTGALTVHQVHSPEIELADADHATGIWGMQDIVEPAVGSGFPRMSGYGHYHERYVREDGRWRICALRLTRLQRTVEEPLPAGSRPQ
ncbi:nuclear transport factor 2 family protein [Pseudonocardia sp. RS010]|uniref:nuclear transport factor 2 family protein n=1 Tax=Pseudonocardia sp. RS010 TaxID=3385979 RepID=UPI00399EE972